MLQKILKIKRYIIKTIKKAIATGRNSSPEVDIATLITNVVTIAAYCTVSEFLARYQGTEKFLLWAKIAAVAVTFILAWKIICLVGDKRIRKGWRKLKNSTKKLWQLPSWVLASLVIWGIFVFFKIYFISNTECYVSVTEVYGIPTGIGIPLSSEEQKKSAGYWEIKDYPLWKHMELTYREPYEQLELMKQYSSVYSMQLFQPPAHVVYKYKKDVNKYREYDQNTFAVADANEFREPLEISYYSSGGKLLLKLEKGLYDKFSIVSYSSEDLPQLLNSTLLQIADSETGTARMTSQQIETTYNSKGMPETRKLFPYCLNTYGINGERYVYDKNNRLTDLYYLDIDGEPVRNKHGIMKVSFKYEDSGRLHSIRYFGDENGNVKVDGINDVFCERFFYDTNGNLITHEQLDKNEMVCSDKNGVSRYRYEYDKATNELKKEDFEDFDDTPVRNINLHSSSIAWEKERRNGKWIISVIFDPKDILSEEENNISILIKTGAFWERSSNTSEESSSKNIVPTLASEVKEILLSL